MLLHWYACISTNTYCFEMYHISLETDWWALPNASLIVRIRSAVREILADEAFTATDVLISQLFVVAFVHLTYVRIALIWGFPAQLSLWKSVHWLWRYKLNEVCNTDHTSLNVNIHISEEFICNKLCTIIKNSKGEEKFIINIIKNIGNINTLSISNKNSLEAII